MWHHMDLGQGFHQACKAPGDFNQEGGGFCLGSRTESFLGGLEASDHYSPMPSADRLSFRLMCYPGSQLLLYHHGFHSLTAWGRQQVLSKMIWFYYLERERIPLLSG